MTAGPGSASVTSDYMAGMTEKGTTMASGMDARVGWKVA